MDSNVKATIHISGRLGFNSNAQKKLNIDNSKFIKIGFGEDFEKDKILYFVITNEEDEETFSIAKAGEYFYANTKGLFDSIGIDYEHQKVIYDITEVIFDEEKYYKLKPRIRERKKDDLE
ncbi:hypothetical protein [Emticicia sp. C21]|uniref:hypothetical protein n=1 Tax=Emticicia sp. C21 TaxID=2302915 RepID=UPI000E8034C5|nr:hypothetical protein [Emticicia sp. C21]RFS15503.1 hypothetical protein D0T08_15235 [Emticicia sp. C21]